MHDKKKSLEHFLFILVLSSVPSCVHQSFSNIPSMSAGSVFRPLSPAYGKPQIFLSFMWMHTQTPIFLTSIKIWDVFDIVEEDCWLFFSCVWWRCSLDLRGQWPKWSVGSRQKREIKEMLGMKCMFELALKKFKKKNKSAAFCFMYKNTFSSRR